MALIPKFDIELGSDCKSLTLIQDTGLYNNPDNLGGFGTPNLAVADVTECYLTIQNLTTEVIYDNLDVTASSTVGNETEFTTEDLEVAGISIGDIILPDGQYCFIFTIVGDDVTYQQTIKKVFLCESCCKIKTKACDIDLDCGCCNEPCADEIWKFLQAYTEMKIIEYSAYCGSTSNINNKIKSLQSFLTTFECPNCG